MKIHTFFYVIAFLCFLSMVSSIVQTNWGYAMIMYSLTMINVFVGHKFLTKQKDLHYMYGDNNNEAGNVKRGTKGSLP